jgi:2-C-methyl-D-erythritol 4-phosphate cytidylyltransferase
MRVTAIIAAGGAGHRVGGGTPKQFLDLDGKTILEYSVAAFDRHPDVTDLVLVVPGGAAAAGLTPPVTNRPLRVVAGGARRQDSVANGFDAVGSDCDVVLIHDAARPFVSAEVIDRTIAAAAEHGAAIAAVASRDTV